MKCSLVIVVGLTLYRDNVLLNKIWSDTGILTWLNHETQGNQTSDNYFEYFKVNPKEVKLSNVKVLSTFQNNTFKLCLIKIPDFYNFSCSVRSKQKIIFAKYGPQYEARRKHSCIVTIMAKKALM